MKPGEQQQKKLNKNRAHDSCLEKYEKFKQ